MSQRFQLALNVENLETAVNYYSKLFGTKVNKRKPGYANFSMTNPPLKLVLIENPGAAERINHLGIETDQQSDVDDAISRFKSAGIAGEEEVARYDVLQKKTRSGQQILAVLTGNGIEYLRILQRLAHQAIRPGAVNNT